MHALAWLAPYAFWSQWCLPWAADASESAGYLVEVPLGRYSSGVITEWSLPDEFDRVGVASLVPDHPKCLV